MRKYCFTESAGAVTLTEENSPAPLPAKGEVLVRVHAAGIIPTEAEWYPTHYTRTAKSAGTQCPPMSFLE